MSVDPPGKKKQERFRRYWDKHSRTYDREMGFFERVLFKDSRSWVCSQASGETLEVGIGTGLNIPFYPASVQLTGIDLSDRMLDGARTRAREVDRAVDLRQGNAAALPFADNSFDTVVCTFALCCIPEDVSAIKEMMRVLRPNGPLLLADHVAGRPWAVRAVQRLLELATVPLQGEHFLRRPLPRVQAEGFHIEKRERFGLGTVERLVARKPG